ncbi:MAG: hypothetical protein A3F11_06595 [Gammaproteobacteria bacterium RIFCSPHIGHO2_12_FULL_37_14]|nr:MAG: hypothetical protein A3F11_06595 [Gammaproteobacteria bacterium RIFCSPHIGHO2_12_FULL_37_14]
MVKKPSVIFVICLFFIFASVWLYTLLIPVVSQRDGIIFYLKPGTSESTLIADLSKLGMIRSPFLFTLYTRLQPTSYLKTGEYYFPEGSSAVSIWRQVTQGRGFFQRAFTIIPGWSFKQVQQALLQAEGLEHELINMDNKEIMRRLGYLKLNPEGEFYPETYYYTRGYSDFVILKRANVLMQKKLNQAWKQRASGLPYQDIYQMLIVASLIEKETHVEAERPMIAGVIINRLKKNMLLQIDPTVIYGMGEHYQGKITKKDLIQDTPYNTYVHKGLPPTPIAMPSMSSIQAALHPIQHQYYYFVALGKQGHQFSETLIAHQAAVAAANRQPGYFNERLIENYLYSLFQMTTLTKVH